ncbi:MAG: hypothetical protein ACXWP4_27830, partial [Polyangiales bacterium]
MQDGATADTLAADSLAAPSKTASTLTGSTFARSTVLPRHRPLADQVRYELVRPLGEGGMGEVVLVTDHDIGRQVAVKRLKAGPQEQSAV